MELLKFTDYAQYNRIKYSPEHVEKNFYKIQSMIIPSEGDRILFVTVNPENTKFDWYAANNSSNAFDFIIRKILWRRKGKYIRPYVGAIEKDDASNRYHFHGLVHLCDLKTEYSDDEIQELAEDVIFNLSEINSYDQKGVDIQLFSFSETTRDYGQVLHYMVKSSSEFHDPLKFKVYSRNEQESYAH